MTVIDDYLATVSAEQRKLMQTVREEMAALLPGAEEGMSYGIPCFKVNGKALGGFAATKHGCSYYPFSGSTLGLLSDDLGAFSQTKSALHFTEQQPLTPRLVRLLLETRQRELAETGH